MRYKDEPAIRKNDAMLALSKTDVEASEALIRASLWIDDPEWVENLLLSSLGDSREGVRRSAIIGLGHLGRLHGMPHLPVVISALRQFLTDPVLGGSAEDAIEDIAVYSDTPEDSVQ